MYRVFLEMCNGTLDGDLLTVYAPDDMTLGRIDNDRVRGVLTDMAVLSAGGSVRVMLTVGTGPQTSPQENLQNLLKFGSQFDSVEIK